MFDEADLIHRSTRAQVLADGLLIDVTETAREAGIRYPTALTRALFEQYVRVPEGVTGQDVEGRLWDILWLLRCALSRSEGRDTLTFTLQVWNDDRHAVPVPMKAVCGHDDDGMPCLTVMLPDED